MHAYKSISKKANNPRLRYRYTRGSVGTQWRMQTIQSILPTKQWIKHQNNWFSKPKRNHEFTKTEKPGSNTQGHGRVFYFENWPNELTWNELRFIKWVRSTPVSQHNERLLSACSCSQTGHVLWQHEFENRKHTPECVTVSNRRV